MKELIMVKNKQIDLTEIASAGTQADITNFYSSISGRESALTGIISDENFYARAKVARADMQVISCFDQRVKAVTSLEWDIIPGDDSDMAEEAADFIRAQFKKIKLKDISGKILQGIFFGFSASEILWELKGDHIELKNIKTRNPARFNFDIAGNLLLRTRDNYQGMELPDKKFITFRYGGVHSDKYKGEGLSEWLYWPSQLKKLNMQEWLIFYEKFAMPTVVAKYPQNTTKQQKEILLEVAGNIRRDTAAVIPDGIVLELLESAKASGGDYDKFMHYIDSAIAKVILSQTMTTDDGASFSQANVHKEVADYIKVSDAEELSETYNDTVVVWLMAWNYNENTPKPTFKFIIPKAFDKQATANSYATLTKIGYRPTPERIKDEFGEGFEDLGMPATTPQNPNSGDDADFAENSDNQNNNDRAEDLADILLNGGDDAEFNNMLADMRNAIIGAKTYDMAEASLAKTAAKPPKKLGKLLANIFAFGHLQGADDIQNDKTPIGNTANKDDD